MSGLSSRPFRYVCTTCDARFDDLPEGTIEVSHRGRSPVVYEFPNGRTHSLKKEFIDVIPNKD
jgi:hypothetical protein